MLEDRIIELCSRSSIDDQTRQDQIKEHARGNLDWDYIAKSTHKESLSGLFYYNLRRFGVQEAVPFEIRKRLEEDYFRTTFRNVIFLEERDRLLKFFKKGQIPVMVLKGAFLLENVYSDLGMRPMGDIDILVKKEDLLCVHNTLVQLGYTSEIDTEYIKSYLSIPTSPYLNSTVYIKRDNIRICLNVHWHIYNTIFPIYTNANIDIDKIWDEMQIIKGIPAMAPHHLLIHLSEHAFRHCFDRCILLTDIAEVIDAYRDVMDWEGFLNDSFEFKLERHIFYSIYLAVNKLDINIPKDILTALKPDKKSFIEKIFLRQILAGKHFEELSCFASLATCRGFRQKLAFLKNLVVPPAQVLSLAYSKQVECIDFFDYASRIFRGMRYITKGCLN